MADFHFLQPAWLWLIIPVLVLTASHWRLRRVQSAWSSLIAPQLLTHLLTSARQQRDSLPYLLFLAAALIGILALANPVWEKRPEPIYQTTRASIIVLDLSASMNAADLRPSRLVRARLKVRDILARASEGQTGLVVFAGDAFAVTPLTRDRQTIVSQLMVLTPELMPVQGSRVDRGLELALELLRRAGIAGGDILLVSDGVHDHAAQAIASDLQTEGHRLSVLGIGTTEGAPISNGQGDVMRDANGKPVLARLTETGLQQLALQGGGRYSRISLDDSDIDYLLEQRPLNNESQQHDEQDRKNQWKQTGPYLTLLLLPLAALAFRRGWLLSIGLLMVSFQPMQPAMAFTWDDLWLTSEQQASRALDNAHLEEVLELSSSAARRGSAYYLQQDYQQALEQFAGDDSADGHYNLGNTLARLGQYREAIAAYDEALQRQPGMQHAIENRAALEKLLQQQQQAEQSQQQQENNAPDDSMQNPSPQTTPRAGSNTTTDQQAQTQQDAKEQDADPQPQSGDDGSEQQTPAENQAQEQTQQQDPQQAEQPANRANDDVTRQDDQAGQNNLANKDDRDETSSERQLAVEQWLRRIPDDPGGLLKRKFLYQYQQRNRRPDNRQAW